MNKGVKLKKAVEIQKFFSFFKENMKNGYSFDGEFHDYYEVVCVLDGKIGITSEADAFILTSGQAIIHSPMEFHKIRSFSDYSNVIIFSFEGTICDELFGKIFKAECNEIGEIFEDIKQIFEFSGIYPVSVKSGMERDLQFVVNRLESFVCSVIKSPFTGAANPKNTEIYLSILSVLEENIEKCLTLDEVARLCNMSVPSLKKNFAKYSGMGVISYFSGMKMKKATTMLRRGMSVKETAFALGFTDRNYFSYAFKKITGKSPSEFKG